MSLDRMVRETAIKAKEASRVLAGTTGGERNAALARMASAIEDRRDYLIEENSRDIEAAEAGGISGAFLDRLKLTEKRISEMVSGIKTVASLPDPVGRVVEGRRLSNGLFVERLRVPLGVVAVIYESRPNVTVDAASLTFKSGNAVILRGGKEAVHSNRALAGVLRESLEASNLPPDAVSILPVQDREAVPILLSLEGLIDLAVPRGGEGLIRAVVEASRIPVVYHGKGLCHTYVHRGADERFAEDVVINAKCGRPGVCNAMETLLVDEDIAPSYLPRIGSLLIGKGVEIRGCAKTLDLIPGAMPADADDWDTEYLDLVLSIRVVSGIEEAIEHIEGHGSHLADAIITEDIEAAERFVIGVDSAAVFVNASTRFTDGGQFEMGAEIGISTQKLHARGPMGVEDLTSVKWVVRGRGHTRA